MKKQHVKLYSTILLTGWLASNLGSGISISAEIIKQVLTLENAQKISEGKITLENRLVDSLLFGSNLHPDQDNDHDGLTNKHELYTYEKDNNTYFGYYSHPILKDSDGDGLSDGAEKTITTTHPQPTDPQAWNVTSREMALFMELAYRDDDYIRKVLDPTQPLTDIYLNRQEYVLMHKELSPYWRLVTTFHESNGFDAALFETTARYPFVKEGSAQVLAIRGTKGVADADDDTRIFLAMNPGQAGSIEKLIDQLQQDSKITNLYLTGHSLGGYLAQRGFIYAKQKNYDWVTKSYTFNAPKIKGNIFNGLNNVGAIGDQLTQDGKSIHYATDNDTLITLGVGHFKGTTFVGKSNDGHGSRSFLEPLMNGQYDFTLGDKTTIHETGYIDPNLANLRYYTLAEKDVYEPSMAGEEIYEGETLDFSDNLLNRLELPSTATIRDITPVGVVNTNQQGQYIATVQVLYSDQSKDEIQIPVTVHKKVYPTPPTVQLPEAQIAERTIPFETIFQEDPTLEIGQEVEQVAGVNGVVQTITIGEQTTEITTTPKVDRIIRVGTKLETPTVQLPEAQIAERIIPFETIFQEDPTLEAGQEVEQVAGVNGVVQTITIGEQTTEITTTPKVDRIIRVGTKLETPTVQLPEAQIAEKTIPFETIFQEDPTLEAGQEVEQVAGVNGVVQTITIGEQASEITTTPKIDRIVRIGTKLETPTVQLPEVQISERTVPFETIFQEDPTLEIGQEVEQVAGVNGVVQTITIGEKTTEITTTPKVDRIVRIGTKLETPTVQLPEAQIAERTIPFETIYQEDPTLEAGLEVEQVAGTNGIVQTITIGEQTTEITTTPKVDRIVRVGTKLETPTVQLPEAQISEKSIPFETIFQEDSTLEIGQEVEQVAGVNGVVKTITIGEQTTEITTTPKIDRIVRMGTKLETPTVQLPEAQIAERTIPFETIFQEDPTLEAGLEVEQVAGVNGVVQAITIGEQTTEITTTPKVDRIVRVGTKLETPTVQLPEAQIAERTIPFETIYQEDPTLEIGQEVEQVAGVNGVVQTITIGEQTTEITTMPKVDRIVRIGTKLETPTVQLPEAQIAEKSIPFETIFQEDPTLEIGQEVEQVAGVNGVVQTITIGEQTTEITTMPKVDRIVRIGTKLETPTVQLPEAQIAERTIPFETIYQEDPTLEAGLEVEQVAGVNGVVQTITIGEQTTEITTTPKVDRIVRIGTKLDTPKVQLPEAQIAEKTIPFETIFQEDPTLEAGLEVEQVAGVNGVVQTITIGEQTTEITTTPKVDRIVRIGTKLETPTVQLPEVQISERTVPFETIFQEDPTLEIGQEVEQVAGVNGVVQTITIGEQTTEITTTPKVDRIVRVGTKSVTEGSIENTSEKIIPFETIFQEDPTLEAGLEVEQVAGVNGVVQTITIGEQTTEITSTPKVDRIVRIGTKLETPTVQIPEAQITERAIPFETIFQEDPTLEAGLEVEQVAGVNGVIKSITIGEQTTEITTTPKVDRIVRVGTKLETPTVQLPEAQISERTIPFETIFQEDPTLEAGLEVEQVAGVNGGVQTITIGEKTTEITTTPKVDRIVRVGTKLETPKVQLPEAQISERTIPFETIYQEDPTLEAGQGVEQVAGVNGGVQIITIGEQTTEITTTPKIDRIVRVGTKTKEISVTEGSIENTSEKIIPFETIYQEDPTLEIGQEIELVTGKDGKVKVIQMGTQTVEVTAVIKVNRLVKIGTKVSNDATRLLPEATIAEEILPFETTYTFDSNLTIGERLILTKGVDGKVIFITIDGQTTEVLNSPPIHQIMKLGTRIDSPIDIKEIPSLFPPSATITTETTPFETIIQENPELPLGEKIEVTAGREGLSQLVTIGQENVGIPVSPKIDQILMIGTKVAEKAVTPIAPSTPSKNKKENEASPLPTEQSSLSNPALTSGLSKPIPMVMSNHLKPVNATKGQQTLPETGDKGALLLPQISGFALIAFLGLQKNAGTSLTFKKRRKKNP
ncbi:TPA: G5 domain-containing protein [Streptococcus suis]|nr:G5 domain-containing protein [Streptococcus suis]